MKEYEFETINWDKGITNTPNPDYNDEIHKKQEKVEALCKEISSDNFNAEEFMKSLYNYMKEEDRLLYSSISNFIFSSDKEVSEKMQINIQKTLEHISSLETTDKSTDEKFNYDTKKIVYKIWDHVNLAVRQYAVFSSVDKEYEKIVDEKLGFVENKITKNLIAQLISLIGIFTALSFLIFGGISSLDNILAGAIQEISIIKLIILATIWSLAILNLVFIFILFIGKITSLNISTEENKDYSLIKRFPIIIWINFTLLTILIGGIWTYIIDYTNTGKLLLGIIEINYIPAIGYIVILLGFIIFNIVFFRNNK